MPKRRTHLPGKYKPKPEIGPNFTGSKPLTLFQGADGLWGVKDGDGNVVIAPEFERAEQTEAERERHAVRLFSESEVIEVTPDDWDLLAFCSPD